MAGMTTEEIETSSDPAVGWLTAKAKQFSDDADELRATTDRAAKGLGALATAGLTAVGIANVGDLYPEPSGGFVRHLLLWLGFGLMVVAIVAFVCRFWQANRPLALSARIAEMWNPQARNWLARTTERARGWLSRSSQYTPCDTNEPDLDDAKPWVAGLAAAECREIGGIYEDAMRHAAFSDGNESLAHYEWRADRLEREALYLPDSPGSRRRLVQVERMRAEIEKAEERAKLVVVRRRMNRVFNHFFAVIFAIVFVVGLVMFATQADYIDSTHPPEPTTTGAAPSPTPTPTPTPPPP